MSKLDALDESIGQKLNAVLSAVGGGAAMASGEQHYKGTGIVTSLVTSKHYSNALLMQ